MVLKSFVYPYPPEAPLQEPYKAHAQLAQAEKLGSFIGMGTGIRAVILLGRVA